MKINVTTKDIQDGEINSPSACPIALAAQRAFGHRVLVGVDDLSICGEMWELPHFVRRKINRFDESRMMEPFSFELTEDRRVKEDEYR